MDRRDFFRRSIKKATNTVVKEADARINKKASHWIRPPYVIEELDFLLTCTRCGDCIDACPHNIIFPLAARLGADVVNTPALDLLKNGCHMCDDWPCVNVCETGALKFPGVTKDDEISLPKIANIKIDQSVCLPYQGPECGACIAICPVDGALTLNCEKPVINHGLCTGCGLCREACITEPKAIAVSSIHRQETGAQAN